jgi:hypothetical protein
MQPRVANWRLEDIALQRRIGTFLLIPKRELVAAGSRPNRRDAMFARSAFLAAAAFSMMLTISAAPADAAGRAAARATVANPDGGVTNARASAVKGPNGGAAVRGRALQTDGQGNAKWKRGATAKGPNGGHGKTIASGQRNADGAYSGGRSTTATGANGNSYSGGYTYGGGNGVTRQATCTNASGAVIPCPRQ